MALRKLRTRLGNQVRDKVWRLRIPVVAPIHTFRHQVGNGAAFGGQQRAAITRQGCMRCVGAGETFMGGRGRTERANFDRACGRLRHVHNFRVGLLRFACMGIFWCPQFVANGHYLKCRGLCNFKWIQIRVVDLIGGVRLCGFGCGFGRDFGRRCWRGTIDGIRLRIVKFWLAHAGHRTYCVIHNAGGRCAHAVGFARANYPQALLGPSERHIELAELLLHAEFIGEIHCALIARWNNVAANPRHNTRRRLQRLLAIDRECWASSFQFVCAGVIHNGVPFQTFGLMNVDDMNGVGARVLHTHRRKRVNKFIHCASALRFKARCFLNEPRNSKLIALIKEWSGRLHEQPMPM